MTEALPGGIATDTHGHGPPVHRLSAYLGAACLVATAAAAEVALPPAPPAGLRYAADRLQAVSPLPVTARLVLAPEAAPAGLPADPEGSLLLPAADRLTVVARTNAGLMYGLLDLADRLATGGGGDLPTTPAPSAPALRLRGDTLDLPFYLGCDLYNGRWRWHAQVERQPDSWWLDRGHWAWRLRRCADLRLNALLLCHPHPFPALVDLPDSPQDAYFDPAHLRRLQEHFRWILDEADAYGVRIYLLTWNIWVSPGFAKAHGIAQEGPPDNELVRQYTQACYRRTFEAYPKLAGVMTMAGEAPPACVEFVRTAIVDGLNTLAHPPKLLFWTWCSYPEDARQVLDAYRGPKRVVHYLQYEQLFRPQADPRIRRTSEALGGLPVVTLGGLGTATGWLYWSDPYYLRDILADLPRQNGDGCFFQGLDSFGSVAEKWLGWQGLARYGWDPRRPREDDYWHARLAQHLGNPEAAPDFLAASVAASAIPTRLLALLHRQTDHFMPQFGLPLVHYLGLPTLSSYVFENHERIDDQGRLAPRLGLTWPNPDWGEKVLSVPESAAGATDGTTPVQIAAELQACADTAAAAIARLRPLADRVTGGPDTWRRCLDQMEMNVWLGRHTAAKIRAALAWEQWRHGQAAADTVRPPLAESVQAMDRLAALAGPLYTGFDIHTFRSAIGRPPPWTHLQVWNTDQYRQHSFADSAALFHRELDWVTAELAAHGPQPLLPFEDDLLARPAGARLLLAWDFEGAPPAGLKLNRFPPDALADLAAGEAPAPLQGRRLVADHRADGFWFPLSTDPTTFPLAPDQAYQMTLDYWILADAEPLGDWLSAGARTTAGGWQRDVGARYLGGKAGTRGRITVTCTPRQWDEYYLYVSLHGRARVEFDNLEVWGP